MKEYSFFAMMARMKYIERWALMRNSDRENISEHSMEVAMLAHGLGIISKECCGRKVDLDKLVLIGLYHDFDIDHNIVKQALEKEKYYEKGSVSIAKTKI